ncbi:hypothetical protein WJT74_05055 [Sphingomicrobium sp. XHP0239]|uniref:hypothetical protein n=1 Tax=Sphingomicrobium maritimum TaxID=3133972 RepID=UPI0031CCC8A8
MQIEALSELFASAPRFTFSRIENAIAAVNGIGGDHRTAFRARLKNLERVKNFENFSFPKVGQGGGRVPAYGYRELILYTLMFEFTQMGLDPQRALEVSEREYFGIFAGVAAASDQVIQIDEAHGADIDEDYDVYFGFDPSGRTPFRFSDSSLDPNDPLGPESGPSFQAFSSPTPLLSRTIEELTRRRGSRVSLVNLSTVLNRLANYLAGQNKLETLKEMRRSAYEVYSQGWTVANNLFRATGADIIWNWDESLRDGEGHDLDDHLRWPFIEVSKSGSWKSFRVSLPGQDEFEILDLRGIEAADVSEIFKVVEDTAESLPKNNCILITQDTAQSLKSSKLAEARSLEKALYFERKLLLNPTAADTILFASVRRHLIASGEPDPCRQ